MTPLVKVRVLLPSTRLAAVLQIWTAHRDGKIYLFFSSSPILSHYFQDEFRIRIHYVSVRNDIRIFRRHDHLFPSYLPERCHATG